MDDELLEVYRELATTLDALLPVSWDTIYVYAEISADNTSGFIDFVIRQLDGSLAYLEAQPEWLGFESEEHQWNDILLYIRELHTIFMRFKQPLFASFFFVLSCEGAFGTEYGYQQVNDESVFSQRMQHLIGKYSGAV